MTELGQHLADLPVEPRLGKMVLYSVVLKCLDPVLTIVCTLAFKEPCKFITHIVVLKQIHNLSLTGYNYCFNFSSVIIPALPSEKRAVMGKRRRFAEETYSDHMVFLRAFQV